MVENKRELNQKIRQLPAVILELTGIDKENDARPVLADIRAKIDDIETHYRGINKRRAGSHLPSTEKQESIKGA